MLIKNPTYSYLAKSLIAALSLLLAGCGEKKVYLGDRENDEFQTSLPTSLDIPSAEPLASEKSISTFQLPPGFTADLVAAEPLIQAPVEIEFDEKGRLWVLEMFGYMSDIEASDEENSYTAFRYINIQAYPRRKLSCIISCSNDISTIIYEDNNDFDFDLDFSFQSPYFWSEFICI